MIKFLVPVCISLYVATMMPAGAGDILQLPAGTTLTRPHEIMLYNSAEQDIHFFLANQDGIEYPFTLRGNTRGTFSDESSQYIIRIPTSGGRDFRHSLNATKRYKIYWNSDAMAWEVALINER